MSKTITVVVVQVGNLPHVQRIKNELQPQRDLVGGNLEAVAMEPNVVLMCNEDGMSLNLPVNRDVLLQYNGTVTILGDFFITRFDSTGDSVSLTGADIAKYLAILA